MGGLRKGEKGVKAKEREQGKWGRGEIEIEKGMVRTEHSDMNCPDSFF